MLKSTTLQKLVLPPDGEEAKAPDEETEGAQPQDGRLLRVWKGGEA